MAITNRKKSRVSISEPSNRKKSRVSIAEPSEVTEEQIVGDPIDDEVFQDEDVTDSRKVPAKPKLTRSKSEIKIERRKILFDKLKR